MSLSYDELSKLEIMLVTGKYMDSFFDYSDAVMEGLLFIAAKRNIPYLSKADKDLWPSFNVGFRYSDGGLVISGDYGGRNSAQDIALGRLFGALETTAQIKGYGPVKPLYFGDGKTLQGLVFPDHEKLIMTLNSLLPQEMKIDLSSKGASIL